MRWLWLIGLFGCGADGDADPTDETDPVVETDLEVGPDGFPVYEAVRPVVRFHAQVVDGHNVISAIPDDPIALLFVFHGTGGGATVVEATEMTAVMNAMYEAGVGFVAMDSVDQTTGVFDDDAAPGDNADWAFHQQLRAAVIEQGLITEATPLFSLGFSAGGAYASYFLHAGRDAGWPVLGGLFHNASGSSGEFRGPPREVAAMWLPAEHDDRVPMDACRRVFDDFAGEGVWMPHLEGRLAPTRFVRTGSLNANQSRQVFGLAVEHGFFDAQGQRLFPVDQIEAKVDEFTTTYDVIYPKPVTAALNVVLAAHAINGEHARAEADFVVAAVTGHGG